MGRSWVSNTLRWTAGCCAVAGSDAGHTKSTANPSAMVAAIQRRFCPVSCPLTVEELTVLRAGRVLKAEGGSLPHVDENGVVDHDKMERRRQRWIKMRNIHPAWMSSAPSPNSDIAQRDTPFAFVPTGDIADGSSGTRPDCPERYLLKIDARSAL